MWQGKGLLLQQARCGRCSRSGAQGPARWQRGQVRPCRASQSQPRTAIEGQGPPSRRRLQVHGRHHRAMDHQGPPGVTTAGHGQRQVQPRANRIRGRASQGSPSPAGAGPYHRHHGGCHGLSGPKPGDHNNIASRASQGLSGAARKSDVSPPETHQEGARREVA